MQTATEERVQEVVEMQNVCTPMPQYESHKKVWALKIANVEVVEGRDEIGAIITPAESGFAPFLVSRIYFAKHAPEAGGYYVQYGDGYTSFSPAKAFEEGYTRI